jgi:hypothetical protein
LKDAVVHRPDQFVEPAAQPASSQKQDCPDRQQRGDLGRLMAQSVEGVPERFAPNGRRHQSGELVSSHRKGAQ